MKKFILLFSIITILGLALFLFSDTINSAIQKDNIQSPSPSPIVTVTPTPTQEPTPTPTATPTPTPETEKLEIIKENFVYNEDNVLTYENAKIGIDVSYFQGDVNWEKVAAEGIEFAIIRLGIRGAVVENIVMDKCFVQNIESAKKAGIKVGVYFYSQAITQAEAIEEAEFVIKTLANYELDYPVFFDWEYTEIDGARVNDTTGEDVTTFANAFLNKIAEAGYKTGIYMTPENVESLYNLDLVNEHDIWYSQFDTVPDLNCDFAVLQHSCTGKVNGINADVDLNLSFVDYD